MSKLKEYKLNELYVMSSGISSSKSQAGRGYPFVSFRDIFNNTFLPENLTELMNTSDRDRIKYSVKKGDVFITRTSETPDELAMSSVALKDYPNATFSGFAKRLRPIDNKKVYDKYMAFYFRSKYFRKIVNANTIMTLRASFNEEIFSYIKIQIPDYDTQVKIGDMLYKIEKKILINNQINNNLEELAYSIFLQRFTKKILNGTIGDIIKENEKSKIKVSDAKTLKGKYPFFTSGESILEWNDYLVEGRNLFFNTGGNADVKYYVGKAMYSTDTWCVTTNGDFSDYLYLYFKTIRGELDRKFFHGSGLKHLQKDLLKQEKIYIPEKEEISQFNILVRPMFDIISENKIESQKLKSLKEFILPLLMNGQINVDDIEI